MEYLVASVFIIGFGVAFAIATADRELAVRRAIRKRAGSQHPELYDADGWANLQRSVKAEETRFQVVTGYLIQDAVEATERRAYEVEGTLRYYHQRACNRVLESFEIARVELDKLVAELSALEPELEAAQPKVSKAKKLKTAT
jgi:hypothetical protein